MTDDFDNRLKRAADLVEQRLLGERTSDGHWRGELSTSALSTATATLALALVEKHGGPEHRELVARGAHWLAENVHTDGGWGDTPASRSNISTTTLCWATLRAVARSEGKVESAIRGAEDWIAARAGSTSPDALAAAILAVYGEDRTFSVPILTHCALAGCLGEGRDAWRSVKSLPFELAALPRRWFRFLGLPVVSYALPALIAVGQVHHHHRPTRNPLTRVARAAARARTLNVLREIQPASGGFLEAVPLTAFVTMSLAASGSAGHPVVREATRFLEHSVRKDGSWPIDTDLATWVTTLAVGALAEAGASALSPADREPIRRWLLSQQYRTVHPYTGAAPGGWAWTDLPGGVPDADDTAGALLALKCLGEGDAESRRASAAGLSWLLDLQNRDGGIPTFCRGWGRLPFDRSGADLTAHALRAFSAWRGTFPDLAPRLDRATRAMGAFLERTQRADGAWLPLWFGNEHVPQNESPVYGTSRVLIALEDAEVPIGESVRRNAQRWLVDAQNEDGGWGGDHGAPSSVEESALALYALLGAETDGDLSGEDAVQRGLEWLVGTVEAGGLEDPTPIGFYFADLWYFERLYPPVYAAAALRRALGRLASR